MEENLIIVAYQRDKIARNKPDWRVLKATAARCDEDIAGGSREITLVTSIFIAVEMFFVFIFFLNIKADRPHTHDTLNAP